MAPRRDLASKACFFAAALPAVARAAWRLRRLRDERFDLLAEQMRRAKPFSRRFLRHPGHLAATADRLLPLLPPRGYGRCFKRSLLLLDLWSRCGLEPKLHLGTVTDRRQRNFHAWVTTGPGGPFTSDGGHEEIWSG